MERSTVPIPQALLQRASTISDIAIRDHSLGYLSASWVARVDHRQVLDLTARYPAGRITRGDLFELGDAARRGDSADRRRLLLGTLMWGYGRRGGRSYRNANIVLQNDNLDERIAACTDALTTGDLRAAYRAVEALSGYDEGFFTKYLYFAGHGARWPERQPRPIIFDSVVRATLSFIAEVLNADWTLQRSRETRADRYLHFCSTLDDWADDLTRAGTPCSADQVELFLFTPGDLIFDVVAALRGLATAAVADALDGRGGPSVSVAIQQLSPDLVVSVGGFRTDPQRH